MLAAQLQQNWGALTPELILRNISSRAQTGNLHNVVFDLTERTFFVAFMAGANSTGLLPTNGFDRQYTKFNATVLFEEVR